MVTDRDRRPLSVSIQDFSVGNFIPGPIYEFSVELETPVV